jgi:hypothetical protein
VRRASALVAFFVMMLALPASSQAPAAEKKLRWYKGNTHTHTLNSDGDSTPDEVVRWYREHGYDFVVITDHNFLTSVDGLNSLHGADEKFLVVRGEEVTDAFGDKPLHINGLEVKRLVPPQGGKSVVDVVQRDIDAIRAAEGVPHINHPNYGWAISVDDLKKIERHRLFEIFNGHPLVNNVGGGGQPSMEEVWDILLTGGKLLYGIAVDDAHHFKRPYDVWAARPGQGWVVVRAERLSGPALLAALERGDFYASTGVEIADYTVTEEAMTVTVRERGLTKFTTHFIGRGGKVLQTSTTPASTYRIRGDEGYVRARVIDSNGKTAWMQPVMVRR